MLELKISIIVPFQSTRICCSAYSFSLIRKEKDLRFSCLRGPFRGLVRLFKVFLGQIHTFCSRDWHALPASLCGVKSSYVFTIFSSAHDRINKSSESFSKQPFQFEAFLFFYRSHLSVLVCPPQRKIQSKAIRDHRVEGRIAQDMKNLCLAQYIFRFLLPLRISQAQ